MFRKQKIGKAKPHTLYVPNEYAETYDFIGEVITVPLPGVMVVFKEDTPIQNIKASIQLFINELELMEKTKTKKTTKKVKNRPMTRTPRIPKTPIPTPTMIPVKQPIIKKQQAYKIMETPEQEQREHKRCPECDIPLLNIKGELICENCRQWWIPQPNGTLKKIRR